MTNGEEEGVRGWVCVGVCVGVSEREREKLKERERLRVQVMYSLPIYTLP